MNECFADSGIGFLLNFAMQLSGELALKAIFIGDSGVGKSSLAYRYAYYHFQRRNLHLVRFAWAIDLRLQVFSC